MWADSNTGTFDPPVVGSFDNKIGHFFTKDIFNGKNIIVVFRWDARDPRKHAFGVRHFRGSGAKLGMELVYVYVKISIDMLLNYPL